MRKNLIFTIFLIVMGCALVYAQQSGVKMPIMVHVEGGTFMMGNANGNEDAGEAKISHVDVCVFHNCRR